MICADCANHFNYWMPTGSEPVTPNHAVIRDHCAVVRDHPAVKRVHQLNYPFFQGNSSPYF